MPIPVFVQEQQEDLSASWHELMELKPAIVSKRFRILRPAAMAMIESGYLPALLSEFNMQRIGERNVVRTDSGEFAIFRHSTTNVSAWSRDLSNEKYLYEASRFVRCKAKRVLSSEYVATTAFGFPLALLKVCGVRARSQDVRTVRYDFDTKLLWRSSNLTQFSEMDLLTDDSHEVEVARLLASHRVPHESKPGYDNYI